MPHSTPNNPEQPVPSGNDVSWVVLKFGGTSVSSIDGWQCILDQISSNQASGHQVLVVVSALAGVTNLLQAFARGESENSAEALVAKIQTRHADLAKQACLDWTGVSKDLNTELNELLKCPATAENFKHRAALTSMGERYSSALIHAFLQAQDQNVNWLDATTALHSEQTPNQSARASYLSARCAYSPDPQLQARLRREDGAWITQGFVASNDSGQRVLLGRGGSDTSAAYFAAKLQAQLLEIWTDVPGLFTSNPHHMSAARLLKQLSYFEAQELAAMGARVLHPRCIAPVRTHDIPLQIRQTTSPERTGTLISAEAGYGVSQVKAIVDRRNITLVSMESLAMWHQVGFLADAFAVFKNLGLSIDMISTSESSVTVSLDSESNLLEPVVAADLVDQLSPICRVKLIQNCASVSLIGEGIRGILDHIGPALEGFENRRIHMLSQASNDLNLSLVVDENDAQHLVQQLHNNLIPGNIVGDSVFGLTWEQLHRENETETSGRTGWWRQKRNEIAALLTGKDAAFVYDLGEVESAARGLLSLPSISRVFYALKANSEENILRVLEQQGCGFECVSLAELNWVEKLFPEIDRQRILFTPNFAPESEYKEALKKGVNITIDNSFIIEHWGEMLAGQQIFLRVDTGSGLGHHKKVRTAGTQSKFGIPIGEIEKLAPLLKQSKIEVVGLHAHSGSGVMHAGAWEDTLNALLEICHLFEDIRFIDIGGGLGVPEQEHEPEFDLVALDQRITNVKSKLSSDIEIWLEPGRYLVAQAGILVAQVTQIKGKGRLQYLGIATGMNSLIRPALYGAWHEVFNLSRLDEPASQIYNLVGPICETGDVLARDRAMPKAHTGDLILITNCGAYSAAMGSNYNMRSPAEALFLAYH